MGIPDHKVTAAWRDSQAGKRAKCLVIAEQNGSRGLGCLGPKSWRHSLEGTARKMVRHGAEPLVRTLLMAS